MSELEQIRRWACCWHLFVGQPDLTNDELETIKRIESDVKNSGVMDNLSARNMRNQAEPETLEDIQAAELARSRFNTEKRTPPGVESSGRIGGPGSIPQDTLDQWDRDAKEQLDRQMRKDILRERKKDRRTFERIAELYNVMMCSAERVIDANGEHVGYKIKTGAVHNLLGVLKGQYLNAFIPSDLPKAT